MMLRIRPEQLAVLAAAMRARVIAEGIADARAARPQRIAALDEETLHAVAADEVARAEAAGITDGEVLRRAVVAGIEALWRSVGGQPAKGKTLEP